jgi:hypothetical protein
MMLSMVKRLEVDPGSQARRRHHIKSTKASKRKMRSFYKLPKTSRIQSQVAKLWDNPPK